jgi:hypothetical protein
LSLTLLALALAPEAAHSVTGDPGWAALIRPYDFAADPGSTVRVWIGVKNQTGEARALCIKSIWYSFDLGEQGVEGGSGKPMSPGECSMPQSGQLLLSGETLFRLSSIDVPRVPAGTRVKLSFRISGVALCPNRQQCNEQEFSATSQTEWLVGPANR